MDYQRIYNEFILDRREKEKTITGYTEKHHITPRSLGGDNSKENIIKLSAQDHYFAHELLARTHGGGMWHALWLMSNSKRYKKSRVSYEQSRIKQAELAKSLARKYLLGREKTDKEIEKISKSLKLHFKKHGNPCKGRKMTEDQKEKLREISRRYFLVNKGTMFGKKHKLESIEKLRAYMLSDKNHFRGKSQSEDQKRKISEAQIGEKNHAYKKQVYVFSHPIHGEFTGTQNNLMHAFSLKKNGVSRLCRREYKQHKGWTIKSELNV